jgi:uncharacterized membrane protein
MKPVCAAGDVEFIHRFSGEGAMSTTPLSREDAERLARIPVVRPVTADDIRQSVTQGWADFRAAPSFGLFFGGVYVLGGWLITLSLAWLKLEYLVYPQMVGFALIGPFVAVGLYEVSRRLERGQPLDWPGVLGVIRASRSGEMSWMAFALLFALIVWMYQIRMLLAFLLAEPLAQGGHVHFVDFLHILFGTTNGLLFLGIGHVLGAILSMMVFAISLTAVPLLLDRDIDFITAMIASVRTVAASPLPLLIWGAIIVAAILASCLLGFWPLFVVLPVLGHATWHLYRKAIAPVQR